MVNSTVSKLSQYRSVFIGSRGRLLAVAGDEVEKALSFNGIWPLKNIFLCDIVITIRWWDPLVPLLRFIRPNIVAVFIADGHFSVLNLNKDSNLRNGKNIFESGYCDVYLLPDRISIKAAARYPGLRYLYHPNYWDNPRISLLAKGNKPFDVIFVYGNDPFFGRVGRERLLTLVKDIVDNVGEHISIAHVVPSGKCGELIRRGVCAGQKVFVGLNSAENAMSRGALYLCTPSTIVWQLLATSAKVALLDVYEADEGFHSSIPRVAGIEDVLEVLSKDQRYWDTLHNNMRDVLGGASIAEVLAEVVETQSAEVSGRAKTWKVLKAHCFRDYLLSMYAMVFRK